MKIAATKVAVAALAAMISAPAVMAEEEAGGSEVTAGLDIASAYIFRGATLNDGVVAQPYVEVAGLPVTFGVWGNFDIDEPAPGAADNEFSEIDIYASYDLPIDGIDASVGYTEYTYPMGGAADREIGVNIGLGDLPLGPSLGIYYGIDGAIDESIYADISGGTDVELGEDLVLSVGVLVAYMDPDVGEDGFSHYELSAGLGIFEWLSLDVTYLDEIDDDVMEIDEDFVAALRSSITF